MEVIFINRIKDGHIRGAIIQSSKQVRNAKSQKFLTNPQLVTHAETQTLQLLMERDNRFRLGTDEKVGEVS